MNSLSKLIDSVEVKFFKLSQKLAQVSKKNEELQVLLEKANSETQVNKAEIQSLKQQIDNLKTANALLGSDENKRETKLKINSLIRGIDHCIAQLSE